MAISAEHRSKFATLHRQWLRLKMSEKFSSRKLYSKQTKEKGWKSNLTPNSRESKTCRTKASERPEISNHLMLTSKYVLINKVKHQNYGGKHLILIYLTT